METAHKFLGWQSERGTFSLQSTGGPVPPFDLLKCGYRRGVKTPFLHPCRNTSSQRVGRHVCRNNAACGNDGTISNRHARQDDGAGTYPDVIPNNNGAFRSQVFQVRFLSKNPRLERERRCRFSRMIRLAQKQNIRANRAKCADLDWRFRRAIEKCAGVDPVAFAPDRRVARYRIGSGEQSKSNSKFLESHGLVVRPVVVPLGYLEQSSAPERHPKYQSCVEHGRSFSAQKARCRPIAPAAWLLRPRRQVRSLTQQEIKTSAPPKMKHSRKHC